MNDYNNSKMARIFIGISIILFVVVCALRLQNSIDFCNSHEEIYIYEESKYEV